MADEPTPQAPAPPRPARKRLGYWRPLRWVLSAIVLLAVVGAAGVAFLTTPLALEMFRLRAIAAGEGRLVIEGAEGSLLSTVRVARIVWRGEEINVEAEQLLLAWRPIDLLSKRISVYGLGAKRVAITLKGSQNTAALPDNLALPFEVDLQNVGVQQLELINGDAHFAVEGLALSYSGGRVSHALRNLRFVTSNGTLAGEASIGAITPFPVAAALTFAGDGPFRGAAANLDVDGTLARLGIAAKGSFHDAQGTVQAAVAPLAATQLITAKLDVRNVDVSRFFASLPGTRLDVTIDAVPASDGFAGTLSARNANIGSVDAGRIPVSVLTARFAVDGRQLALDDIAATLTRNGRATGSAIIPLDGAPTRWTLAVRDIDLAGIYSALGTTQLAGTIRADVAQARQNVHADLRQADMALRLDATVIGRAIEISALQARAGASELTGRGRISLERNRPFDFTAQTLHFDPSRFGAFPAGSLDATMTVAGVLAPTMQASVELAIKDGSRIERTPIAGTINGKFTPDSVADAVLALRSGAASLTASGGAGTPGARLAFKADIPDLGLVEPWLARYGRVKAPGPLSGKLRTEGTITFGAGIPGFAVDVHAEALAAGTSYRLGLLNGRATLEAAGVATGSLALTGRKITLDFTAGGVATPAANLRNAHVDAAGTLDRHAATLAVAGDGFATQATVNGSLAPAGATSDDYQWSGTIATLVNEGSYPVRLSAPATVTIARERVRVSSAQLAIADGSAQLDEFQWTNGRIDTSGRFNAVPVGAIARLARIAMPMKTTLTLGGQWALHASPRLNGTLHIYRESGDLYIAEAAAMASENLAFGITELALDAKWIDDAVDAYARFRSARAGTADAAFKIAAVAGVDPLFISTKAPLAGTLTADLPTLRPLQPLLGTAGVADGSAHLNVAVAGTLAAPLVTGTLTGDGLRLDFPQYGMHFIDGKLRAALGDGKLSLEELSFGSGDGRFTAKGTVALPTRGAQASSDSSHITWQASRLRIVNRPDLHIVGSGNGTLALANRKLVLAGKIAIDSGRIEYRRTDDGRLGNDVVIVGAPKREPARGLGEDLPLFLDLDLSLGDDLAFSGEGFDAHLEGQLRLVTLPTGVLNAKGTFRAVNGTYFAFGQRLTIDQGRLVFNGPLNNPALDIVALRKNAQVEAGIEITGTLQIPHVRLTSNPPVPDNEKLSWLLTGQGLDRASGADIAAISAASLSLLTNEQRPITTRIAQSIGLDDISFRQSNVSRATGTTTNQVVAFGKRITDRLTLVYEQGLTVATNALRMEYALTRSLTLRAEAGVVSSIGIFFRRSYD